MITMGIQGCIIISQQLLGVTRQLMKSDSWLDVVVRHSRYVPSPTRGLRSETLTAQLSSPLYNLSTTTSTTA